MRRRPFAISPLERKDILPLYPVVVQIEPRLGLPAWRRFARRLADKSRESRGTGALVARRQEHAHPCGFVCYRPVPDLTRGRILLAQIFVGLDLLYPREIASALLVELEAVAVRLRCGAVRASVPIDLDAITSQWTEGRSDPPLPRDIARD